MPVHNRTPLRSSAVEPITAPSSIGAWWIPDLVFGVLRVATAFVLLRHGVQEYAGRLLPAGERWAGQPELYSQRWTAAVILLVGGALLAAGLFTRLIAFLLSAGLIITHFAAPAFGIAPGHWMLKGAELIVLVSLVLLTFAAVGPGLFSVDALTASLRTRTSWGQVPMSPWIKRQARRQHLMR
jgi:putative oxidoreductase